jgi:hypothetical protein
MAEPPGLRKALESLIRDGDLEIVSFVPGKLILTTQEEASISGVGWNIRHCLSVGDYISKSYLEPKLRAIMIPLSTHAVLFGTDGTVRRKGFVFYWHRESIILYFGLFISTAKAAPLSN